MQQLKGVSISQGLAVGKIVVLTSAAAPEAQAGTPEEELARFQRAQQQAVRDLGALYEKARAELGEAEAEIFSVHQLKPDEVEQNCAETKDHQYQQNQRASPQPDSSSFCHNEFLQEIRRCQIPNLSKRRVEMPLSTLSFPEFTGHRQPAAPLFTYTPDKPVYARRLWKNPHSLSRILSSPPGCTTFPWSPSVSVI